MFAGIDLLSMGAFLLVFLGISVAAYFLFWRAYGDDARALSRLRGLSSLGDAPEPPASWKEWTRSALPRLGEQVLPTGEERLARLKAQLARIIHRPPGIRRILDEAVLVSDAAVPNGGGRRTTPLPPLGEHWQFGLAMVSRSTAVGQYCIRPEVGRPAENISGTASGPTDAPPRGGC